MEQARPLEIAFESLKVEALQSPEGLDETFSLGIFQHPNSTAQLQSLRVLDHEF